jgi:hypothetical protein
VIAKAGQGVGLEAREDGHAASQLDRVGRRGGVQLTAERVQVDDQVNGDLGRRAGTKRVPVVGAGQFPLLWGAAWLVPWAPYT